jgi:hypothetical protein
MAFDVKRDQSARLLFQKYESPFLINASVVPDEHSMAFCIIIEVGESP